MICTENVVVFRILGILFFRSLIQNLHCFNGRSVASGTVFFELKKVRFPVRENRSRPENVLNPAWKWPPGNRRIIAPTINYKYSRNETSFLQLQTYHESGKGRDMMISGTQICTVSRDNPDPVISGFLHMRETRHDQRNTSRAPGVPCAGVNSKTVCTTGEMNGY